MQNGTIVSVSRAMRRALELVDRFGPTRAPVLLVGPTGVGKEVLAQRVHALSGRTGPFIDVNCGALPPDLIEAELFGHRRGAFTGAVEAADGLIAAAEQGTLFLDELTTLPLAAQPKLLRAVETQDIRAVGATGNRRVDFRLVSAVQELPGRGHFRTGLRDDLFHRLAGVVIAIPALADRMDDVVPLARHFAGQNGRTLGGGAEACLMDHTWPGNVRELRTAVERACVLGPHADLDQAVVLEAIRLGSSPAVGLLAEYTAALVAACEANGWDAVRTAAALGIARSTLFRRLAETGVSLRRGRKSHFVSRRS